MMHPTLRYGSHGGIVRVLQHLLNEFEHTHLGHTRDGIFGPRTRAAVIRFQTQRRLEVDGIVGPHTWAALGRALRLDDLAASAERAAAAEPKPILLTASHPQPRPSAYAHSRSSASRTMPAPSVPTATPKAAAATLPRPIRQLNTAPNVSADLGGGESGPIWYQIARSEYQAHHSVFGTRDGNKRIHDYFMTTSTHPHVGDDVAWCSAFANWCLSTAGVRGTHSAAAASWKEWGHEIKPTRGCIMTVHWKKHSPRSTGNHVTFFDHADGDHLYFLGGNQGGTVKMSSATRDKFTYVLYRMPGEGKN